MVSRSTELPPRLRAVCGSREERWFLIWACTREDFAAAEDMAIEQARIDRLSRCVCVPWPFEEQPPAAHWVIHPEDVSGREIDALLAIASQAAASDEIVDARTVAQICALSDSALISAIFEALPLQGRGSN